MNREQRKAIAERIDQIREARTNALKQQTMKAQRALTPPVIEYAKLLSKSRTECDALLICMRSRFLEVGESIVRRNADPENVWNWWSGCYQHTSPITVNPYNVDDQAPKAYKDLCKAWQKKYDELERKCEASCAKIEKEAGDLKLKIMLMDVPDDIIKLLHDFEKGK